MACMVNLNSSKLLDERINLASKHFPQKSPFEIYLLDPDLGDHKVSFQKRNFPCQYDT